MRTTMRTIVTGAAATVVSGFAIYAASPHFERALKVVVRWVTTPLAWGCLLAVWLGLFCLQQWWSGFTFGVRFDKPGWETAVWFSVGIGLAGWGSYTLFALAHAA